MRLYRNLLLIAILLVFFAAIYDIYTKSIRKYYHFLTLSKDEIIQKAERFAGTDEVLIYHVHCTGNPNAIISIAQPWGDMMLVTDLTRWDLDQSKTWMWNNIDHGCDIIHPHIAIVWFSQGIKKEAMWSFSIDGFTYEKTPLWLDLNHKQKEKGLLGSPKYYLRNLK